MKKIITTVALGCCCILLSAQPGNEKYQNTPIHRTDLSLLKIDPSVFLYAGIGLAVLLIAGYLIYRFFKSTEEKKTDFVPVIKRIYPNPSHGPITIEIQGKASQLKILNMDRQPLGTFAVTGGNPHFDLSSMPRDKYIVVAYYGGTESNAMEFTLQ